MKGRPRFFTLPRFLTFNGVRVYRSGCLFMVVRVKKYGFWEWCGWFTLTPVWRPGLYDSFVNEVLAVLKRSATTNVEGSSMGVPDGGEFSLLYPTLWEHLTQAVWEDGTPRKTSSMTFFSDGPVMKVVLKDKEAGLCLWMACPSMDGLFMLTEAALNDTTTVWRLDRQESGGKSTRVRPNR
jgi:hypothetical protein